MKDIMNRIAELRELSARIERSAAQLGRQAAGGIAPDAELAARMQADCEHMAQLRGSLNERLRSAMGPVCDFDAIPLSKLEIHAEEYLRARQQRESVCSRICDASLLLQQLNMPGSGMLQARELALDALEALARDEAERLNELERRAQPFIDMAALLRGDDDGALLDRVAMHHPELAWFLRARAQLACGAQRPAPLDGTDEDCFPELADEAVTGLRQARTDEKSMNPAPVRKPLDIKRLRVPRKPRAAQPADARNDDAPALPPEEPDDPEEPFPLPVCTYADADTDIDKLRAEAQSWLQGCAAGRPARRGVKQAVWDRLTDPDEGLISRALGAVCGGGAQPRALIWELHARLMIPGTATGVHVNGLCDLIRAIWAEEAVRWPGQPTQPTPAMLTGWLIALTPALRTMGRWCALTGAAHALMPA